MEKHLPILEKPNNASGLGSKSCCYDTGTSKLQIFKLKLLYTVPASCVELVQITNDGSRKIKSCLWNRASLPCKSLLCFGPHHLQAHGISPSSWSNVALCDSVNDTSFSPTNPQQFLKFMAQLVLQHLAQRGTRIGSKIHDAVQSGWAMIILSKLFNVLGMNPIDNDRSEVGYTHRIRMQRGEVGLSK